MSHRHVSQDELRGWFAGRLPNDWFTGAPEVTLDREEILVVGTLPDVELEEAASDQTRAAARESRIEAFREDTRRRRMEIAEEAQERFGRIVSWGAAIGDVRRPFTTASIPVMTRLRQPERQVLDTLVSAGVARSRSEALAWCVKLVGEHQTEWIDGLREALQTVEERRRQGPLVN
jgi:hypothetical protein